MGEESHHQAVAVADPSDALLGLVGDLPTVSPVKLANSVPLRLAHRYSTGLSSGA